MQHIQAFIPEARLPLALPGRAQRDKTAITIAYDKARKGN